MKEFALIQSFAILIYSRLHLKAHEHKLWYKGAHYTNRYINKGHSTSL